MGYPYQSDSAAAVTTLGGSSMVFHCHYYNCQLQEAIEQGMGADALPLLTRAATDAVVPQLRALFEEGVAAADALRGAEALFGELGFGALALGGLGAEGGEALCPHSHYAMGWLATRGLRETPCCHFPAGFVAGAFAVAHGVEPASVRVCETHCFAMGADECRFAVEVSR